MHHRKMAFFIILLVACLAQFGSDVYSSALPAIAKSLATSISLIQFNMAIYMLGVGLSELIYGPLSDSLGSKVPLLAAGLTLTAIGTVICVLAPKIDILLAGRFIQGCGAVLWRSMFRDLFTGAELSKYGTYFAVFITFIIPAAPTVGGYLTHYLSWRAIFVFLLIYTLLTWFMSAFYLHETNQHRSKEKMNLAFYTAAMKELLTSRIFIGHSLCAFFSYGIFFSWPAKSMQNM